MLNNKGVSIITLIITIVVIIILAAMTIFNSFDTVEDAHLTKTEKEYNDVSAFVINASTKVQAGLVDVSLTESTLVTRSQIEEFYIYDVDTNFTSGDTHKIINMNESIIDEGMDPKYGYHYFTGKQIENGLEQVGVKSNLDNVDNNYIINFYYGVVVAKVSDTKTNVTGAIK